MLSSIIASITLIVIMIISLISGGDDVVVAAAATPIHGGGVATQRQVAKKWAKYSPPETKPTFRQLCFPKEYRVQRQQAFLGEYMDPINGVREILVYHKIGAGKTCAAIQMAQRYRRPVIVMPASLISGFRAELQTPCADGDLSESKYTIMSYNKFAEVWQETPGDILIVDEVHNLANDTGSYYSAVLEWVKRHPRASVVLMTATPIFDSPQELGSLSRLMRGEGNVETPEDVAREFEDRVSYYAGAPDSAFPEKIIKYVKLPMSAHQARWYKSETASEIGRQGDIKTVAAANNFYAASRQRANVVYPNGLVGDDGLRALTRADILTRVGVYSCKMEFLRRKLRKRELTFIYSSYTGAGGIDLVTKCLRAWGYHDYFTRGPGFSRYAVFEGETSDARKDEIRRVFNGEENDDGSKISVIIGSPAMNAGISLMRVRSAHILNPHWNDPRMEQIMGRPARFCSHKTLPADQRNVRVYIYVAYVPAASNAAPMDTPERSIDAYMLSLSEQKKTANEPYLQALRDVAFDRRLHHYV